MKTLLRCACPVLPRALAFLVAAACGAACGTTGSTLRVNAAPSSRLGAYGSVQIVCVAEDEKERGREYVGRLENQLLVKLRERDTFREYRLSTDPGQSDVVLKVTILDLKKAGGWGWYGRSSSKISCDAILVDTRTGAVAASISVVANPKYSTVQTAVEDAATQIADYLRENK